MAACAPAASPSPAQAWSDAGGSPALKQGGLGLALANGALANAQVWLEAPRHVAWNASRCVPERVPATPPWRCSAAGCDAGAGATFKLRPSRTWRGAAWRCPRGPTLLPRRSVERENGGVLQGHRACACACACARGAQTF